MGVPVYGLSHRKKSGIVEASGRRVHGNTLRRSLPRKILYRSIVTGFEMVHRLVRDVQTQPLVIPLGQTCIVKCSSRLGAALYLSIL